MEDDEKAIILNYNPQRSIKVLFWVGLLMLIVLFLIEVFIGIWDGLTWMENLNNAFIMVEVMLPVSIVLWVIAFIKRWKMEKGLFISISPKGVTDSKGRLIPIADIDHCHLLYHSTTSATHKSMPAVTLEYLVVQMKSGKQKKFKIRNFDIPECILDHDEANEQLGISLFTKKETVHIRHYDS